MITQVCGSASGNLQRQSFITKQTFLIASVMIADPDRSESQEV